MGERWGRLPGKHLPSLHPDPPLSSQGNQEQPKYHPQPLPPPQSKDGDHRGGELEAPPPPFCDDFSLAPNGRDMHHTAFVPETYCTTTQ